MAVKVQFQIGHTSKLRAKKTPEGFTHDWELQVQGVTNADISSFVDKIVFNLHKTFPKPKRVLKEPPYMIQESGYAGFLLPIDIYFRSRDEPKKFEFTYDLHLQRIGPPQHHKEVKNFIFENPSEEFRQKLLKGGGVPVAGVVSGGTAGVNTSTTSDEGMVSKPKLSADSIAKKQKSRSDESKISTFANLFGTPITKSGSTKYSPDSRANSAGNKGSGGSSGNLTPASSTNNNVGNSKEKPHKERDKNPSNAAAAGSSEKIRDKSEKKDKYKQSSPYKEPRSELKKSLNLAEHSKHEKRNEEKSKKDKSRDKERDRSREKGGSSTKRTVSPKGGNRNVVLPSPKRLTPPPVGSRVPLVVEGIEENKTMANKIEVELKNKEPKSKESSSTSSSKKSKKDKKDKDKEKDREKDRRDEHKHRGDAKAKEERTNLNVGSSTGSGAINLDGKETKSTPPRNSTGSSKKNDKEIKLESSKVKPVEKHTDKEAAGVSLNAPTNAVSEKKSLNSGSTGEKEKKSHKHKRKEKTKDKEKERERDKEREKDKDKVKDREKDKDKVEEKVPEKPVTNAGEIQTSDSNNTYQVGNATSNNNSTSKKSQNKEKKSKEKLNKDEKRSSEADTKIAKNTTSASRQPSSSSTSIHSGNLEISDVDSPRSLQDSVPTSQANSASAQSASVQHSDSSNSSFPDLVVKSSGSLLPPPTIPVKANISSPSSKESRQASNNNSKEQKLRNNEKNQKLPLAANPGKPEKLEKENKKRRRNSAAGNTFIEPPVKQAKKEQQIKSVREKSKSPLLRPAQGNNTEAGNGTFMQPPPSSTAANVISSPIPVTINSTTTNVPLTSAGLPNDTSNNVTINQLNNTTANTPTPLILPMDYLNELQELHQKIMTLQDGEELQQVVEMIAATGCYEITSKTFDFDLCKLDRNTVQRLQEFFATSVS